jgi:hypothetical protein
MKLLNVVAVNDNITLFTEKENIVVNRIKSPEIYKEVLAKVIANDIAWLEKNIQDIKTRIESKTSGVFSVENNVIILRGTNIPVPELIVKKLLELEKEAKPILPLLRFWRKLSSNPSENSRKDLYTFMTKNNIPITEDGDIVTEKGVSQRSKSYPGDLVDDRTKTMDNSIGSYVTMDRSKVNADSSVTCSHGLHVAAPDYVRNAYSSSILVECIVNPRDVVSVPKDYNATKMRVCAYRVAGYSRKESRKSLEVVKLSDFFSTPIPEEKEKIEKLADVSKKIPTKKLVKIKKEDAFKLENKSAKEIVEYIKNTTGEIITISLKSKKAILKKAENILEVFNVKNLKS